MEQNKQIRVLVSQGYCLLREALIERLDREKSIDVCATASDMNGIRERIERYKPHVLVMNISLKCCAGIASLKQLKHDYFWQGIVALSCDSEFENTYIGQALRAGADAYVSVDDSLEDLVRAIQAVESGKPYLSELTKQHRKNDLEQENLLLQLSRREAEVFCLTGCGHVPQRIADMMSLSVKTVESYRERIRAKMGLYTGADLQHTATSFMRSAARRGIDGAEEEVIRVLLSATG